MVISETEKNHTGLDMYNSVNLKKADFQMMILLKYYLTKKTQSGTIMV